MNRSDYDLMKAELKSELTNLFKVGSFNGIVDILMKYHPQGEQADTSAQVSVVSEFIQSDKNRNELDLLCALSVSECDKKYSNVGYGEIPSGKISVNR